MQGHYQQLQESFLSEQQNNNLHKLNTNKWFAVLESSFKYGSDGSEVDYEYTMNLPDKIMLSKKMPDDTSKLIGTFEGQVHEYKCYSGYYGEKNAPSVFTPKKGTLATESGEFSIRYTRDNAQKWAFTKKEYNERPGYFARKFKLKADIDKSQKIPSQDMFTTR